MTTLNARSASNTDGLRSRLFWTDEAWPQLLGRSPQDLNLLTENSPDPTEPQSIDLIKDLEQRLAFMRVILVCQRGETPGEHVAVVRVFA